MGPRAIYHATFRHYFQDRLYETPLQVHRRKNWFKCLTWKTYLLKFRVKFPIILRRYWNFHQSNHWILKDFQSEFQPEKSMTVEFLKAFVQDPNSPKFSARCWRNKDSHEKFDQNSNRKCKWLWKFSDFRKSQLATEFWRIVDAFLPMVFWIKDIATI